MKLHLMMIQTLHSRLSFVTKDLLFCNQIAGVYYIISIGFHCSVCFSYHFELKLIIRFKCDIKILYDIDFDDLVAKVYVLLWSYKLPKILTPPRYGGQW